MKLNAVETGGEVARVASAVIARVTGAKPPLSRNEILEHVIWSIAALREVESDLVTLLGEVTLREVRPGLDPQAGAEMLEKAIGQAREGLRAMTKQWRKS